MSSSPSYTSRTIKAISFLWLSLPIMFLIYSMLILSVNLSGIVKIILSPGYWMVCALAVLAAHGVMRIRWYGWYAFVLSNLTVSYETAVTLAYFSDSDFKFAIFLATALFQAVLIFLVGREIRVPYYFPRIRWWESDPRYKLSVPTKIVRGDKSEIEGEIMDISMGGCFVKTHHYFVPDEPVSLDFTLFERPLSCPGNIVWRTESMVTHPKGVGIKFESLNKDTVYCLKQATQKLRKLARTYSQLTREKNWQEYLQREQRYQGKKDGSE